MIVTITDDYSLDDVISGNHSSLIVIDFFASWCAPCRMMAPIFQRLSERFTRNVLFLKVDVDVCRQTSSMFRVQALPTFLFLMNGREVDRICGADLQALENKIMQYLNGATNSTKSSTAATLEERRFLERFASYSKQMVAYEEEIAQTLALSLIPTAKLEEQSMENGEVDRILLLKNLLKWFKAEFFSWIDEPKCDKCSAAVEVNLSISVSKEAASVEEARFGACVTEVYRCESCSSTVRFPRFNDPVKLLETRKGRCAEWANCFVLCCRALKYETRQEVFSILILLLVLDVTDHVWCELWMPDLDRWVHCDPCEAVYDVPLLYERGWGKKLSYVIAFAIDHIRDVTWRYTFNHKEVLKRRTACREIVLRSFLSKLNERHQSSLPEERKSELQRRYLKELVEFLSPNLQVRENNKKEHQGRITGSEEWKKARGEEGGVETQPFFVIRPTESDIDRKVFCLQYNCSKDEYKWGDKVTHGWKSFLYKHVDVFRKEEFDWKMVYLCRKEEASTGELCWLFDFGSNQVKDVEISVKGMAEFHDGKVYAVVCSGNVCQIIPKDGILKMDKINGKLELKVTFCGSDGDCPWQNAQLFRSELNSSEPDFNIVAHFL
uniref:Peptide-N(4)-(N-acetyl-beta-glucosaminyl)asparagine amidase n=1 Tax=Syphacia muris TaxID=451379 RepID=A0A0N5AZ52_9BILA